MVKVGRKNLIYRFIAATILLFFLIASGFSFYKVISYSPEAIILDIIALSLTAFFCVMEMIFILKGGKKDSHLYEVAFNKNGSFNSVALIAVIVGTVISLGLTIMCIVLMFIRSEKEIRCNLIIITSISLYLFVNCLIYFVYLFMFKEREFKIENLIK